MNDLVSRQELIQKIDEYLEEYAEVDENGDHSEKWCAMMEIKSVAEELPDHFREGAKKNDGDLPEICVGDMISREAAIDAVHKALYPYICGAEDGDVMSDSDLMVLSFNKAVCNGIKALPAVQRVESVEMRWIPCAERPPKEGENVFVYLFGQPYIAWFDGSSWRTEDFDVDEEYAPVAWMPLPRPWKGEE